MSGVPAGSARGTATSARGSATSARGPATSFRGPATSSRGRTTISRGSGNQKPRVGQPEAAGRRGWGEGGSALVEVTWLAILLLVPLLYIVLAVFEVQRGAFAATAAARSAGRAFVLAPDPGTGSARAEAAARLTFADQRLGPHRSDLAVSCTPDPGACLAPGSVVTVTVAYQVPLPLLPSALGDQTPSVRVEAVHAVPFGTYREARP